MMRMNCGAVMLVAVVALALSSVARISMVSACDNCFGNDKDAGAVQWGVGTAALDPKLCYINVHEYRLEGEEYPENNQILTGLFDKKDKMVQPDVGRRSSIHNPLTEVDTQLIIPVEEDVRDVEEGTDVYQLSGRDLKNRLISCQRNECAAPGEHQRIPSPWPKDTGVCAVAVTLEGDAIPKQVASSVSSSLSSVPSVPRPLFAATPMFTLAACGDHNGKRNLPITRMEVGQVMCPCLLAVDAGADDDGGHLLAAAKETFASTHRVAKQKLGPYALDKPLEATTMGAVMEPLSQSKVFAESAILETRTLGSYLGIGAYPAKFIVPPNFCPTKAE